MSERVQTAERLVEELSPEELSQFANWFADFQDRLWEQQIERDANAGKLDALASQALRDFDAGRARRI